MKPSTSKNKRKKQKNKTVMTNKPDIPAGKEPPSNPEVVPVKRPKIIPKPGEPGSGLITVVGCRDVFIGKPKKLSIDNQKRDYVIITIQKQGNPARNTVVLARRNAKQHRVTTKKTNNVTDIKTTKNSKPIIPEN